MILPCEVELDLLNSQKKTRTENGGVGRSYGMVSVKCVKKIMIKKK